MEEDLTIDQSIDIAIIKKKCVNPQWVSKKKKKEKENVRRQLRGKWNMIISERKRPVGISRRSSGFHTKRAEKFTFVPQTTAEVQRECTYMRARACVRICAHGGLVNEHKIGSDRSWKRSSGKLSGARRRNFFYPVGSTNRLRSHREIVVRAVEEEGQGLECLTAGS